MTDFGDERSVGYNSRPPVPLDDETLARAGSICFVGPEGDWDPEDLRRRTEQMPAVTLANRIRSDAPTLPIAAVPNAAQLREAGQRPDGVPEWRIPSHNANQATMWEQFTRAAARAGSIALLLAMGAAGAAGFIYVSQNMNAGHPTAIAPISTPYTPTAAHTPNATPTTKPTPPPKPTPTTQPPTQTPPTQTPPTPTPQPTAKSAEWGETNNAQTYSGEGTGPQGVLSGDQTNMYDCQTNGYDKLQSPPQGAGQYVKASDVQLANGANSLPTCGTANTSSAPATAMSSTALDAWRPGV